MHTFKVRGLVLREYQTGESDKRISLFCKGRGRLMVHARGARKSKSKFLAASQMLTYGDYIIAEGRNFLSMSQAEVIEGFYPIRQDYDRLCSAQYIIEICEKAIPDKTPCDEILYLALKTLQHISGKYETTTRQAVVVFLFRFFLFYGVAPGMVVCCKCGGELDDEAKFCDEGMVCGGCTGGVIALSPEAKEAILHILGQPEVSKAFMFRAKNSVLDEIDKAAQFCWNVHFVTLTSAFPKGMV